MSDHFFDYLASYGFDLSSNIYVIWNNIYGVMQPLTQAADGAVKLLNMIK